MINDHENSNHCWYTSDKKRTKLIIRDHWVEHCSEEKKVPNGFDEIFNRKTIDYTTLHIVFDRVSTIASHLTK